MAIAEAYSYDLKTLLLIIVAMIIVGMSLQDRKTTFVGKLISLSEILDRLDDAMRQNVSKGYDASGATRPVSLATYFLSMYEHIVTLEY